MRVKTGVGEALSFVFPEELTIGQTDVVDLVARTLTVETVPLFLGSLAFPKKLM